MKRTDPLLISEIIDKALAADGQADNLARQRASYLWTEIVGPGVNRHTSRRYVDGSTLHVFITSAVLKHELSFHRATIVEQINRAVGKDVLTEIVIH